MGWGLVSCGFVKCRAASASTNKRKAGVVDLVAELVGVTLGPKGRNVVLQNKYGPPKIVNDGETVLKQVVSYCIENAASVAKTFLMSYLVVVEIKEEVPRIRMRNPISSSGVGPISFK